MPPAETSISPSNCNLEIKRAFFGCEGGEVEVEGEIFGEFRV